ncbi:MAG: pseudouridine synthase [Woeseiaceae bacterium]|nr:pseudouridine synthase [Woeseiaceae bacterium]
MPAILFNKPFRVLSQFRDSEGRATLAEFIDVPGVYPAGRLDYDSEGVLLLTDDGRLQARISQPRSKIPKTYLAQVEGMPSEDQLNRLRAGVQLKDGAARALSAVRMEEPAWLWPRNPPIRYRKNVCDSWIELVIDEGRNRQVRRMTAAVGLPTLRLVRVSVGPFSLDGLQPGQWRSLRNTEAWKRL